MESKHGCETAGKCVFDPRCPHYAWDRETFAPTRETATGVSSSELRERLIMAIIPCAGYVETGDQIIKRAQVFERYILGVPERPLSDERTSSAD